MLPGSLRPQRMQEDVGQEQECIVMCLPSVNTQSNSNTILWIEIQPVTQPSHRQVNTFAVMDNRCSVQRGQEPSAYVLIYKAPQLERAKNLGA